MLITLSAISTLIVPKGETAMHYGNILEYLSLWSEVQFLNVQNSKISKKSEKLTYLDFTSETCQKIEKLFILNSRYRGIV